MIRLGMYPDLSLSIGGERRQSCKAAKRIELENSWRDECDGKRAVGAKNGGASSHRDWFEVTLSSIGDAVIAADLDNHIRQSRRRLTRAPTIASARCSRATSCISRNPSSRANLIAGIARLLNIPHRV